MLGSLSKRKRFSQSMISSLKLILGVTFTCPGGACWLSRNSDLKIFGHPAKQWWIMCFLTVKNAL